MSQDKDSIGSPEEWLQYAKGDLKLAKIAFDASKEDPEIREGQVCYNAQQAAEKSLKAILISKEILFPFSHDLSILSRLLEDSGVSVSEDLKEIGTLTPYAVQVRYPGYFGSISIDEAQQALDIAEKTIAWAEALILIPPFGLTR